MSNVTEYALMIDWEDGKPAEVIPAKDAHHAEQMARTIYAGRPSWTVERPVSPWFYSSTVGAPVEVTSL